MLEECVEIEIANVESNENIRKLELLLSKYADQAERKEIAKDYPDTERREDLEDIDRINSEIKKTVEEIYARTGMTLTDAFNIFIQQTINVEGLPFLVTQNSKEALREQAVALLMMDLKRAEERADKEGWIDADDLEKELGV